jgi:hypothetical protein
MGIEDFVLKIFLRKCCVLKILLLDRVYESEVPFFKSTYCKICY